LAKGQSKTLTLNLQKTGPQQHTWEPKTNVTWISLLPNYGSVNTITTELDQVKVSVSTANMAVGTNSGMVWIWDTRPGLSRLISVPVMVTVTSGDTIKSPQPTPPSPPPAPPTPPPAPPSPPPAPPSPPPAPPAPGQSNIAPSPSAYSATVVKGQSASFTVNLQKAGTAQHTWEPKTSVPWISLSPAYGSINTITSELDKVQVTINTANLNSGTNSGLVYIWESGPGLSRLITVPVTITVTSSGTPPSPPPPSPPPSPPASQPNPIGSVLPPPPPPPPPSPPVPTTGTATVTWAANNEADLAGYKLYVGTVSGVYNKTIDVGNRTSYVITLPKGVTYFFAVTAYDKSGHESRHSGEQSRSVF
jgi:hypothetical protein